VRLAVFAASAAVACGGDSVVVEVDVRAGIGELASLEVVARNDGDEQRGSFDLTGVTFPTSFSLTTDGRSGDIEIELAARDGAGLVRAVSFATAELGGSLDLELRLDPADFVVNTTTDGAQRPVFRAGRYGKQIAETGDGGFAVTFVNDCLNPATCDVFLRRFDADGQPVVLGGSSDERAVNSGTYPEVSVPAIAAGAGGELALIWEISTAVVIAETDADGMVVTSDTPVSDPAALDPVDPAIAVADDGSVLATWVQEQIDASNPEGVWQGTLDGGGGTTQVLIRDSGVAATPVLAVLGGNVATTWAEGSSLLLAISAPGVSPANFFQRSFDDPARVHNPNIAVAGSDVIIGYGVSGAAMPGLETAGLVLSRVNTAGNTIAEVVVTSAEVGDTVAVAVDAEGRVAAVWQGCDELGDGNGCGIFMSLYDGDLNPLADPIRVNTTTAADQISPSVAAIDGGFAAIWADFSRAAPDDSPAVRGRPIYLDAFGL
jgi:hypothetical protein